MGRFMVEIIDVAALVQLKTLGKLVNHTDVGTQWVVLDTDKDIKTIAALPGVGQVYEERVGTWNGK